jgi:hypothetical protein
MKACALLWRFAEQACTALMCQRVSTVGSPERTACLLLLVSSLCSGCGKFVEDSWRIFCRGHRDSKGEECCGRSVERRECSCASCSRACQSPHTATPVAWQLRCCCPKPVSVTCMQLAVALVLFEVVMAASESRQVRA